MQDACFPRKRFFGCASIPTAGGASIALFVRCRACAQARFRCRNPGSARPPRGCIPRSPAAARRPAAAPAAAVERARHGAQELVVVERLDHVVDRAGAQRGDRAFHRRVAGDHDDRQPADGGRAARAITSSPVPSGSLRSVTTSVRSAGCRRASSPPSASPRARPHSLRARAAGRSPRTRPGSSSISRTR